MGVNHPGIQMGLDELIRMVQRISRETLQNASLGRAGLRIYDGGILTIENGGLSITGTGYVSGTLGINGVLSGTGNLIWAGPWSMSGPGDITGNVIIRGALNATGAAAFGNTVDVLSALRLGSSGYIEAGTVRIDRGGAYGGRIASSSPVLMLDAGGSVVVEADNFIAKAGSFTDLSALGTISANIKNFRIPHPSTPGMVLQHGATESPVSGVEYWGDEVLPESGELDVTLPHYFEALTKPLGRVTLVTARGFIADWGDIVDGTFTVTGEPGGRFSWLVKAERIGADFVLEEPVYGPHREGVGE